MYVTSLYLYVQQVFTVFGYQWPSYKQQLLCMEAILAMVGGGGGCSSSQNGKRERGGYSKQRGGTSGAYLLTMVL